MLSLLTDVYYSELETLCRRVVDRVVSNTWPVLNMLLNSDTPKPSAKPVAPQSTEERHVVMTTRRGIRIVASKSELCFYGPKSMIRARWEDVPAIIASLRSALVPFPYEKKVDGTHVDAALDMASSFDLTDECIFTIGDAEDIVKGYSIVGECPDPMIAGEISHVLKIGPKKLYRYIENEIVSIQA